MAIAPDVYDMTIQRRSDHSVSFEFKDSNNSAVNLQGYTIISQIWDASRSTKAADATCTITDAPTGAWTWKVTDTQTATFSAEEYKYDVLVTEPGGDKQFWVEGTIYMSEGYSS